MKKRITITAMAVSLLVYLLSSCYTNKEDLGSLPQVSFMGEVVPIMISSGCGCHNNNNAQTSNYNAFPFTRFDTTYGPGGTIVSINRRVDYGAIIGRVDTLRQWVNGTIGHPGGGIVDFTPREREIIRAWIAQGPPYDGGGAACDVSGTIKYTTDILPIYNSTCKSSGCHGGRGPALDYNKMVADKNILTAMMNSGGAVGHPGGVLGMTTCTINKFQAWIAAGQPN
jgi:hypothetical protein